MSNLKAGDVGVALERTLTDERGDALDVSWATGVYLLLRYPDETTAVFTAGFSSSGTDGKVRYVTLLADDLNQTGHYIGQFKLTGGSNVQHSDWFHFDVDPNIV